MSESSPSPEEQEALELKGDIDWNIEDVDSGKVDKGDASINWDIGHDAGVKIACEAEESGGGIDWGIEQHLITDEAAGTEADNVGSDINWDIGIDTLPSGVTSAAESAQLLEGSTDGVIVKGGDDDEDGGGINWDIDVDDVGVDTLQSGSEETGKVLPVTQDSSTETGFWMIYVRYVDYTLRLSFTSYVVAVVHIQCAAFILSESPYFHYWGLVWLLHI
jgi:hypothetical protein